MSGIEIFGAVTAALKTVDLLRVWIQKLYETAQELHRAASTLQQLDDDLRCFQERWKAWQNTWEITNGQSEAKLRATWGKDGWRSIYAQVIAIEKICANFEDVLVKLVDGQAIREKADTIRGRNELRDKILGPRRSVVDISRSQVDRGRGESGRSVREADAQALAQAASQVVGVDERLEFVFIKSGELRAYPRELNDRYNILRNDAYDFFGNTHPNLEATASLAKRRGAIAQSVILQHVVKTKIASEALYWASLDALARRRDAVGENKAEPVSTCSGLELKMSESTEEVNASPYQIRYSLTLYWPDLSQRMDILVQGPLQEWDQKGYSTLRSRMLPDLKNACLSMQKRNLKSCDFKAYAGQRTDTVVNFHAEMPVKRIHEQPCRSEWLRGFLDSVRKNAKTFPVPKKAELAFSIVQSGLYLLGTSWLSHLDSSHVQRGGCGRFLLGVTDQETYNDLASIEPQTFHIGALLAEIALSTPIDGILRHKTELGEEADLVMTYTFRGRTSQRSLPARDVVFLVQSESKMGIKYAKAVSFCLQQSGNLRQDVWRKTWQTGDWDQRKAYYDERIFCDFYEQVYKPLEDLNTGLSHLR